MHGGESMAFRISEAFPWAIFVHAKEASNLEDDHLKGRNIVILVDWVVNEGKGMLEFVKRIVRYNRNIRIVIVAGVRQEGATMHICDLTALFGCRMLLSWLHFVCRRISTPAKGPLILAIACSTPLTLTKTTTILC